MALVMFTAVTALLMLSFFLYQAYLISVGRTTYETLKHNQLLKDAAAAATADENSTCGVQEKVHKQSDDCTTSGKGVIAGSSSSSKRAAGSAAAAADAWRSRLFGWRRQQQQQQQQQQYVNYYDRGFWGNWYEVLWPDAFLQQYRQQLAAAAETGDGVQHIQHTKHE
jgi:hypothetical protein